MPVFTSQPAKELNGVKSPLNPHTELAIKGNAVLAIAEVISMNWSNMYMARIGCIPELCIQEDVIG